MTKKFEGAFEAADLAAFVKETSALVLEAFKTQKIPAGESHNHNKRYHHGIC